ncbi:ABC transporter transmembrane domain-containing protein [Clostridium sporogenes]|uniref:ABC transporter transmembrane domain-containing protein n=1 Tax=Clostridium sporogenes TaxID=1509 RepID=UPI0006680217|nr:ABC transporter ATP-binding protein [Clostridium sporogenes]
MNKKKFSLFIINLLKPYSKKIILLFLVTIFTILFDLSQPIISKNIIDGALKNYNYQLLLYFLGILIVITILGLLLSYIQKSTINKIEEKIKYDIRLQIFKCILNHDINFFKDKDVGELMSRMLGETSDIIRFLLNSTMNILMNIIYILILIIIMFSLNSIIALVNLLFGIITLFLLIKTGTRINVKQEKVIKKFSEISNNINESIFNIKTIKYLGIYTYVLNKIKKVLNEDYNLNIKYKIFVITINTFLFLVIFIPNIFLWGYGGYLVVNHVMTIGSLIALSNYFQKFMSNINELKSLNVEFQKFIIMCKRLEEIINNYIEADSIFLFRRKFY